MSVRNASQFFVSLWAFLPRMRGVPVLRPLTSAGLHPTVSVRVRLIILAARHGSLSVRKVSQLHCLIAGVLNTFSKDFPLKLAVWHTTSESVQSTSLPFQSIDYVHGGDSQEKVQPLRPVVDRATEGGE